MKRERVQSSMIASLGHETKTSTLEIEFNSGAIWRYYDVSERTYHDMMNSGSHGQFFLSDIKDEYHEEQIR
jgi:hypothetical protein